MIKNLLFYTTLTLVVFSQWLRVNDEEKADAFLFLGFLGILIYYTASLCKNLMLNRDNKLLLLKLLIILMTFILCSKYLLIYLNFWIYPSILIVPIFILQTLLYFYKYEKDIKTTLTIFVYLIFTVPLFAFEFNNSPERYIPEMWYNRFDVSEPIKIQLNYFFKYEETKDLHSKAKAFTESRQFYEAIETYKLAINIEPNNPWIFFDMAGAYASSNNIEKGIASLDTAILHDDSVAAFYNNRGLMYYKLTKNDEAIKNFQQAIKIDSTIYSIYSNMALAYYYKKEYETACKALAKAEALKGGAMDEKPLIKLKNKYCY